VGKHEFSHPKKLPAPSLSSPESKATGENFPMSQKIAFITGGNRGLGFQTAL
jgi:hypothetical protein